MQTYEEVCKRYKLAYRVLNNGKQVNIKDRRGQWHSYYPTTGTMVFNRSDDLTDKRVLHDVPLTGAFVLQYFINPRNIENLFKEITE